MDNIAPKGKTWVCCACGKTAKDKYGPPNADPGWDESCMLNAVLVEDDRIVRAPNGRILAMKEQK